jgi:micrococcal nuclease
MPRHLPRVAVARVVDGDTIDVAIDGRVRRVRYIGVDTPERGRPLFSEATDANRRLLESSVMLEQDVSETDRYGRLLRYVWTEAGFMVNAELVRQGFARTVTYPPDVRYVDCFLALQRQAREAGRGLWHAQWFYPTATLAAP